ncbi:MAG: tetratricopeptide repeat protein [Magnetococcales bacterium]|nr:tetratricopeptide repeat protein [Magnetococcales bacterium]
MSLLLETLKSAENIRRAKHSHSGTSSAPAPVPGLADLEIAMELEPDHKTPIGKESSSKHPAGERSTLSQKSDPVSSADWDFLSSWEDGFPDFDIGKEKTPEHRKAPKEKAHRQDPVLLDDLEGAGLIDKRSAGDRGVDFSPSMEVVLDEDVVIHTDQGDGNIALGQKEDQTEITVVQDPRLEGDHSEALTLLFEEPPKKELIAFESIEKDSVTIGAEGGVATPDVVVEPGHRSSLSMEPAPVIAEPLQGLSLELEASPFLDPVATPSLELAPTVPLEPVATPSSNQKTATVAGKSGERHGWSDRFFSKVPKNPDRRNVQEVEDVSSGAVEVSDTSELTASRSSSSGARGKGDAWSKASKLMASRRLYEESVRRRRWIYSIGAVVATVVVVVAGYFVNEALAPFDEEILQSREEKTARSADLKPLNVAKVDPKQNVGHAPSAPWMREQGAKIAGGPLGSEAMKNAGLPTESPKSEEKQVETVKQTSEIITSAAPPLVQENGLKKEEGIRQPSQSSPKSHFNEVADSKSRSEERQTKRENRDQHDAEIVQASEAFRKGHLDKAERLFLRVYKANNRDTRAMVGLASVASRRGNVREEEYYYRKVLRLDPRNSMALAGLAGIQGTTKVEGEESYLRQQLRETPEAAHLHFFQGNMLASQKRWSEAVVAFKSANRLESGNPEILVNLAVALDHLNQTSQAITYYQQALDAAQRYNKVNFNIDSVRHRMTVLVLQTGKF